MTAAPEVHLSAIDSTVATPNSPHSLGSRIARGAASSFAIGFLSNLFLFVGQLIIPRALSREEYAQFIVSLSFVTLFALLADLGMSPFFTRAFAQAEEFVKNGHKDERGALLGSALALRLMMSVIVAALVIGIGSRMYSASMVSNMAILCLTLIISSRLVIVRSVGEAVLRSEGKYYVAAAFALLDAIAFAGILFFAQHHGLTLTKVIWIYTLCNVPGFVLLCVTVAMWVKRNNLRLSVKPLFIVDLLKQSVPLMLATAFMTIHTQIDNLLLDKLSNPFEVSSYGATVRLFSAMAPVAVILAAVTAPELTRLVHRMDFARSRQLTHLSLRLLLVVGAGIALVLNFASADVVRLLLGEKYASAGQLLSWTGWMLLPVFTATFLMEATIAAGDFWITTWYAVVIMVVVILGDILLIPEFGAKGALLSKLTALTTGNAVLIWLSRKSAYLDINSYLVSLLKLCAALLPSAVLLVLASPANNFALLFAASSLALFGIMIHFTRFLSLHEVLSVVRKLRPQPTAS